MNTFLAADLTIANTIISDNSESGLFNQGGQVMILNSTLSGNSAGQENAGGGVNSPSTFKRPGSIADHQQYHQRQLGRRRRRHLCRLDRFNHRQQHDQRQLGWRLRWRNREAVSV